MLDRSLIGHEFPNFSVDIEKGRLKFFAKAIGETDPIYTDEASALEAGHKSIPAPPTFLSAVDMEGPDPVPVITLLNLDIGRVLHGAQAFEYFEPVYAGDTLTVGSRVKNIFDKKGGALEFVEIENSYTNQSDTLVARAICTLIYTHPRSES
ncbi:MaoC family dehydratase N-terminal domain-containing protein [Marinobacterium mangrovicola]|uniref:Acyl dehydratase n=1 Tax=Marinobacterium mangrovicola TaxID=1476959 RepID=A0A4R1GCI5_9GAMM|nr:MaoC family dehydratase N-terminal domain-containing protein [Marinobacterium mangrovicola]TCK04315.1 acyl dehydratase [Marinobacterium mangrovicola]